MAVTSAGKELVMVDPESPTEEPLVYQVGNGRGPGPKSNNLYVCGLDAEIDDAKFEEVFSKFGTVLSAKVMVDIHTGVSRGFGFILFETLEQGVAAQEAMNGRMVMSKPLTVRYSGQHQTTHLLAKQPSMYVRNIPMNTPREVILTHFGKFGTLVSVETLRDTAKGATGVNIVLKIQYQDSDTCDKALRATHCRDNPFLAHAAPGQASPKLLAKFAEPAEHRAQRRIAEGTARPALPPPPSYANALPTAVQPMQLPPSAFLSQFAPIAGMPPQFAPGMAPAPPPQGQLTQMIINGQLVTLIPAGPSVNFHQSAPMMPPHFSLGFDGRAMVMNTQPQFTTLPGASGAFFPR